MAKSNSTRAMGRSDAEARQVLRFTLGSSSSGADVSAVLSVLPDLVERARAASGTRTGAHT